MPYHFQVLLRMEIAIANHPNLFQAVLLTLAHFGHYPVTHL